MDLDHKEIRKCSVKRLRGILIIAVPLHLMGAICTPTSSLMGMAQSWYTYHAAIPEALICSLVLITALEKRINY